MEKTPRLGLDNYELGDENWDHSDTVEAVDEYAIDRGSIADRPDDGNYDDELYYAIDQRIIWRWNADTADWNAISGLGTPENPVPGSSHFETITTGNQNNIRWARTPDEITDRLAELPEQGGLVRLVPGEYSDDEWSETITIPTGKNGDTGWGIDLGGSKIDLETFDGPYIERPGPAGTTDNDTVFIRGPNHFHVDSVDDPGTVMRLWDTEAERIYWPSCYGSVDAILEMRSSEGSGHWGQGYVNGSHVEKGIVIGHPDDPQTKDRGIWSGHLGHIQEIGVHVRKGQAHHFYVQPENGEGPENAIGYKIEYGNNTIYNWHSGDNIQPLDIQSPHNVLRPIGRLPYVTDDSGTVAVGVPPRNIFGGEGRKVVQRFEADITSLHNTSSGVSVERSGTLTMNAGTEGLESFQTAGGVGPTDGGTITNVQFSIPDSSNRIDRIGMFDTGENIGEGTAIFLEGVSGENWVLKVLTEGTEAASIDTGEPVTDTPRQEIILGYSSDVQTAYLNYEEVAESTVSIDSYDLWNLGVGFEVEVVGTPSDERALNVFEYGTLTVQHPDFDISGGLA